MKTMFAFAAALLIVTQAAEAQQSSRARSEARRSDPLYRSAFGLNNRPYAPEKVPSLQTRTHSYYRGAAGDVITSRELPRNALSNGYRYVGEYGASRSRPTPRRR